MKTLCIFAIVAAFLWANGLAQEHAADSALTPEQQLALQTSLAKYYQQAAAYNYLQAQFESSLSDQAKALRAQLAKQGELFQAADKAVADACPGVLSGLHEGAPKCDPKPPEKFPIPPPGANGAGAGDVKSAAETAVPRPKDVLPVKK